jgi:hypothetical protein
MPGTSPCTSGGPDRRHPSSLACRRAETVLGRPSSTGTFALGLQAAWPVSHHTVPIEHFRDNLTDRVLTDLERPRRATRATSRRVGATPLNGGASSAPGTAAGEGTVAERWRVRRRDGEVEAEEASGGRWTRRPRARRPTSRVRAVSGLGHRPPAAHAVASPRRQLPLLDRGRRLGGRQQSVGFVPERQPGIGDRTPSRIPLLGEPRSWELPGTARS